MNFVTFAVSTTNIFPLANSTAGGQLMTEFNLRSRESVGVGLHDAQHAIKYMVGPSYVHAEGDFLVRLLTDNTGVPTSTVTLEIAPGRCILNGHYVESLAPMTVDLLHANARAKTEGTPALKGHLCIGLRAMYSTLATMAGAMKSADTADMYEGVQVVVLPESEFKLPADVPNEEGKVTAHIKLAEFNFINDAINTIVNNYPDKCKYISGARVSDVDKLLSGTFIQKSGLDPKKLYVFSGKGTSAIDGRDTWCSAADSLMVWDHQPQFTTDKPTYQDADFVTTLDDKVQLYMPHKQVDGMTDSNGRPQYYAPRSITIPTADYANNTPGVVDRAYTKNIKKISDKLSQIYSLPNGKQVGYVESLNDRAELPEIRKDWNLGDYILVASDYTVASSVSSGRAPSTMYVIIPAVTSEVQTNYVGESLLETIPQQGLDYFGLTGICLGDVIFSATDDPPNYSDSSVYNEYFSLPDNYRAWTDSVDYFTVTHEHATDANPELLPTVYFYKVLPNTSVEYSEPMYVTGEIGLAQESTVGGFLNVGETALDAGYVRLDDSGHLKLLDYSLLRSGALAYQLGQNVTIEAGYSGAEVQSYLDEYVNNRVAFPTEEHKSTAEHPNVIDLVLNLGEQDVANEINICNIDSRFGTSIYLHIQGDAASNTTINISDCEKIRIDNNIGGSPVINLYRSSLYYDAATIERLNTIEGLKLWYERYETSDPKLLVDNMTVQETDAPIITEDIDFWNQSNPNDFHYTFALRSITLADDGHVVGCGMYVRNDTTANVATGHYVQADTFVLPSNGCGLSYPRNKITKPLKVTGNFVTAYPTASPEGYMVIDTSFTALSQVYDAQYDTYDYLKGTISFHTVATSITNIAVSSALSGGGSSSTPPVIDGWEPNSFHLFYGGTIG